MKSFCKYFSADPAVIKGVFDRQKIRFTQPWGLNDPLEGAPAIRFEREDTDVNYRLGGLALPSEKLFYRGQLIEAAVNSFGMLSLTKIPDSFDMWALYASGHHGFLLEFRDDFAKHPSMLAKDGGAYVVKEIDYVDDYSIDPDILFRDGRLDQNELLRQVFFRKTRRWEHEQEFRIVRPLSDHSEWRTSKGFQTTYRDEKVYLFPLDPECILSVVFGTHMSRRDKKSIYDRLNGSHINFFQACLLSELRDEAGHQGKIVILSLDLFPSHEYVLDSLPQMFSALAGDPALKTEVREIARLSDLPYYDRYPRHVEQLKAALERQHD